MLVGGDYNIVNRYLYTYAGDGIWNRVENNIGEVKKFFVGTGAERKIRYYRCGKENQVLQVRFKRLRRYLRRN